MRNDQLKKDLVNLAQKAARAGLVGESSGNFSFRVPGQEMILITPSGVPYLDMEPGMMLTLNLEGEVLDGGLRPSSERPMHLTIYRHRPHINAVIHFHGDYVTALAVAGRSLPVVTLGLALAVGAEVPLADYARPASWELGQAVIRATAQDQPVAILKHHGAIAMGTTVKEAYAVAEAVEEGARLYNLAKAVGQPLPLPPEEIPFYRNFFLKNHRLI